MSQKELTRLHVLKSCLLGYLEVLRQTLTNFGIPQALYPDRYSVFFVNPKKEQDLSIKEQLAGNTKRTTQFGRIVEKLGIDMFPAYSPQANRLLSVTFERNLSAASTVSLPLSQKHGLRALINGEFYPISFYYPKNPNFNLHAPQVLKELIFCYLLCNAKNSPFIASSGMKGVKF